MNDDAKFVFFLSGFFGFIFFYSVSLVLNKDLILSLIYGTSGSLLFSFLGRLILISLLRNAKVSGFKNHSSQANPTASSDSANISLSSQQENLTSSMEANMAAASNSTENFKKNT